MAKLEIFDNNTSRFALKLVIKFLQLYLLIFIGNGTIDFNEFVNMMININNNTLDEAELVEAFRTFDNDDKGYIFSSELRSVLRYIGDSIPDEEINDIVKDARHGYNRKILFEGNHGLTCKISFIYMFN
jgi:Ca2+-binding EF-hand superfamily protein